MGPLLHGQLEMNALKIWKGAGGRGSAWPGNGTCIYTLFGNLDEYSYAIAECDILQKLYIYRTVSRMMKS